MSVKRWGSRATKRHPGKSQLIAHITQGISRADVETEYEFHADQKWK